MAPARILAPELLVVDASAMVETLIGTRLGGAVRQRLRGAVLHGPAHLDAEVLSALGRLHRARAVDAETVDTALRALAAAPLQRHQVAELLPRAWAARDQLRLVDALYLELAAALGATLISTDRLLARARPAVELVH